MEDFKELREELKNIKTIKDDCSFVAHNIIYNSSFLLEDCQRFIDEGKISFAYPIMRQVYEYIMILMGFEENLISMDEFINDKNDTGFISRLKKRIGEKQLAQFGLKKFNIFREFMDNLWEILCERTHANYDRLLMQNYEYDEILSENQQLKLESEVTYKLLSIVFFVCSDFFLGKKSERNFEKQGKKLKFKSDVCFYRSSTGMIERLLEIPSSKTLFQDRFLQIKDGYKELKEYQNKKGSNEA